MSKILKWLGGGTEEETPRYGILSSRAEWHAFGIGVAIGFIVAAVGGPSAADLFLVFASIAFGLHEVDVGHLKHVQMEPYYALVASVVSFLLTVFVVLPRIPGGF